MTSSAVVDTNLYRSSLRGATQGLHLCESQPPALPMPRVSEQVIDVDTVNHAVEITNALRDLQVTIGDMGSIDTQLQRSSQEPPRVPPPQVSLLDADFPRASCAPCFPRLSNGGDLDATLQAVADSAAVLASLITPDVATSAPQATRATTGAETAVVIPRLKLRCSDGGAPAEYSARSDATKSTDSLVSAVSVPCGNSAPEASVSPLPLRAATSAPEATTSAVSVPQHNIATAPPTTGIVLDFGSTNGSESSTRQVTPRTDDMRPQHVATSLAGAIGRMNAANNATGSAARPAHVSPMHSAVNQLSRSLLRNASRSMEWQHRLVSVKNPPRQATQYCVGEYAAPSTRKTLSGSDAPPVDNGSASVLKQLASLFMVLNRVDVACIPAARCISCTQPTQCGRAAIQLQHLTTETHNQFVCINVLPLCCSCAPERIGRDNAKALPIAKLSNLYMLNRMTRHLRYGVLLRRDAPQPVLHTRAIQPFRCMHCGADVDPDVSSQFVTLVYQRSDTPEMSIGVVCSEACDTQFRRMAQALSQLPMVHRHLTYAEMAHMPGEQRLFDAGYAAGWKLLEPVQVKELLARNNGALPNDAVLHQCDNPSCWFCVLSNASTDSPEDISKQRARRTIEMAKQTKRRQPINGDGTGAAVAAAAAATTTTTTIRLGEARTMNSDGLTPAEVGAAYPLLPPAAVCNTVRDLSNYRWLLHVAEVLREGHVYEDVLMGDADMRCAACTNYTANTCALCKTTHFCDEQCWQHDQYRHKDMCHPYERAWSRVFLC